LDEIAQREVKLEGRILFWISYSRAQSSLPWDTGKLMEYIATHCMQLALMDSLIGRQPGSFGELFPSLKECLLRNAPVVLSAIGACRRFPKITEGNISLNNLKDNERQLREQALKDFFDDTQENVGWKQLPELQCHREDWPFLTHKMVKPEVIYTPIGNSASGEVIYFTQNKDSFHFQFKAVRAPLTAEQIITEARKVSEALVDRSAISFVVVALNVDETSIQHACNIPPTKVVQNQEPLALHIPSGTEINIDKVP
jgi:hypothetical protein